MSRVILPGHAQERPMSPTILVPRGYETGEVDPIAVCRVPTGPGELCGQPFFPGEERAFQRHVGRCAREHADAIHAASLRNRVPITDEANWDPEVAAHMREVGKRMLKEGRLEMLPSERAGF